MAKKMTFLLSEIRLGHKLILNRAVAGINCHINVITVSFSLFISVLASVALAPVAYADIYRFVSSTGVETFTDVPLNGDAKLIEKETIKKNGGRKENGKNELVHTISLNKAAPKTEQTPPNHQETTDNTSFIPKLPPVGGVISSGFGMRIDPIDGVPRHHNGIDIAIKEGTPVTPIAPGVVSYSGQRSGYGNTVMVEHKNGMVSLYAHNGSLLVAEGQTVDTTTIIALSGNTGRSTGPHLHFEAWQGGENITAMFMPENGGRIPLSRYAQAKVLPRIRKEILADGSILFTNIPAAIR